ncbi:penicillin-binding protein activator [Rugamonas sp. CCM 8940]|uniref:penicillin-binding protein activator n=1 Tax=Rugamonas sp. CCM 8940 TaxID=2765359 RepID=UPI001F270DD3|nr:penicillin-binding protein activator [Rugamonas sp. CCM 8940]
MAPPLMVYAPAPVAKPEAAEPSRVETFAVEPPGAGAAADERRAAGNDTAAPANTTRIALLLPLRSEALGQASAALRDGFMAAWERDRDGIAVTVIETGDVAQDVLANYADALQRQDLVVGPLSRSAVGAVAASALVAKPTIALNYPEGHGGAAETALPPQMLAMGLSIEEEARQAAQWAGTEHPNSSALVVATATPWQRRSAAAFVAQWQRLGRPVRLVELTAPNGYLSDPELVQLRARVQGEAPDLVFAALGADQTRQLRAALGSELPLYGTSALNPGNGSNFPDQELDGVRLLDLPWQIQRDHPAVMVYPRPPQTQERRPGAADLERLYALGIDAFRVARQIARQPSGRFVLDGVTGRLAVSFGQGTASFERVEQAAVYKNGVPQPVAP